MSKPKKFDLGNYRQGESREVSFGKTGIVYVNCHLHANMGAAIVVTPNDWNAPAERDGRFVIPNVPPGHYSAVAWHKSAGFFRQTVDVTEQGNSKLEFLIPLAADGTLAARN